MHAPPSDVDIAATSSLHKVEHCGESAVGLFFTTPWTLNQRWERNLFILQTILAEGLWFDFKAICWLCIPRHSVWNGPANAQVHPTLPFLYHNEETNLMQCSFVKQKISSDRPKLTALVYQQARCSHRRWPDPTLTFRHRQKPKRNVEVQIYTEGCSLPDSNWRPSDYPLTLEQSYCYETDVITNYTKEAGTDWCKVIQIWHWLLAIFNTIRPRIQKKSRSRLKS